LISNLLKYRQNEEKDKKTIKRLFEKSMSLDEIHEITNVSPDRIKQILTEPIDK